MHCRKFVVKQLAQQLRPQLEAIVKHNDAATGEVYSPDAESAARRAVKNKALAYLAALGDESVTQQVLARFRNATNMTDKIAALSALIDSEGRRSCLAGTLSPLQSAVSLQLWWAYLDCWPSLHLNSRSCAHLASRPCAT